MARVVIDIFGSKTYYNDHNKFHREDGPAFITRGGTKCWYENSVCVRKLTAGGHSVFIKENLTWCSLPNGNKSNWDYSGETKWPELK